MQIALVQTNPRLASFAHNREEILIHIHDAKSKNCDLVVFPECSLFGYHPFDLLERVELIDDQLAELKKLSKQMPKEISALVGFIDKNKKSLGRPYYNAVALLQKNKKPRIFYKQLLPTVDVFDEARFIEQGQISKNHFVLKGQKILLTICEDIWAWPQNKKSHYNYNPLQDLKGKKFDLIINMSASPFFLGKLKLREFMVKSTARFFKAPMIYVNMVGAQDEVIYDGSSFAVDSTGKKTLALKRMSEDFQIFKLGEKNRNQVSKKENETELLRKALVLGLKDFVSKIGMSRVHLGLSGGIDSAVVACLAVDALGAENVAGLGLPGPYSSDESLKLAQELAKNLNIKFYELSINESFHHISQELAKHLDVRGFGIVHENLQARLRGLNLMAFSNSKNSLLLSTSNKAEIASGYSTLYGDMCGGLMPIGDLSKAQVYQLAELYNLDKKIIPQRIITRDPTAELKPDQRDQDTLPPYDDLDKSVVNLVQKFAKAKTETDKWLLRKIYQCEFKRWQAPPILKVSSHSFGRGRRYPVAFYKK